MHYFDDDSQGHVDVDAAPDVDAVEDQPVVAEDGGDPAEGHGQYPPPDAGVDEEVPETRPLRVLVLLLLLPLGGWLDSIEQFLRYFHPVCFRPSTYLYFGLVQPSKAAKL